MNSKVQNIKKGDSFFVDLLEHITTVSHVLLLSVTIFVIYLCAQQESFNLTTWHVFLYILGWAFISTEGMMIIAKENIFGKHLVAKWRQHVHWLIFIVACGLTIGGFATIVYSKQGRKHFTSEHGKTGFASLILTGIACINGMPTLFTTQLRRFVSPNILKVFHALVGLGAVAVGLGATITGYKIGWFTRKVSSMQADLCIWITIVCTIWGCLKPLLNIFVRSKNIVKSCTS
nr:cytochrome b561 domain-containing protein 2 [Onthophagus taurus]